MKQFREGLIRLEQKLLILALLAGVCAWGQGYSGPQIMSRGGGLAGDRPGSPEGIHYYMGVTEGYEVGLLPALTTSTGQVVDLGGLFSMWASWGAYGKHQYRRTQIGLDYTGVFRHYFSTVPAELMNNGTDHTLRLSLTHQPSRQLAVNLDLSAGSISRFYLGSAQVLSPISALTPSNYAFFDSRAYFADVSAGVSYRFSPRWTASAIGSGFVVDHKQQPLIGLQGYSGMGVLSYQFNSRQRVDASMRYQHIDYVRGFGESDSFVYMVGVGQRVSRHWGIDVGAGAARIQSTGLQSIATDPLTQALFGITTTVQAYYVDRYSLAMNAGLRGSFQRWSIDVSGSQMPSAGNGLYMTSSMRQLGAHYRYSAIKKTSLGAFYTYSSMAGYGQTSLGTTSYSGGGGDASYKLTHLFDLTARYDARKLQFDAAKAYHRVGYMVSVGVSFHPNDIPLSW